MDLKATPSHPSRNEIETRILARVRRDESFKRELLEDPKAALKKAWGVELPDEVEIRVVEETDSVLCLVLPPRPTENNRELRIGPPKTPGE